MWVPVAVWQCYFTLLHFTTSMRILTNWPTDWLTDWLMSDWLIVGLIYTLINIISVPVTDVAASLTPDRFFTLSLCVWHAQSITAAGAMTASVRHWTMPRRRHGPLTRRCVQLNNYADRPTDRWDTTKLSSSPSHHHSLVASSDIPHSDRIFASPRSSPLDARSPPSPKTTMADICSAR